MSTHDELTRAAVAVDGLVMDASTPAAEEHFEFTAYALREAAGYAAKDAEVDGLAHRLHDAWLSVDGFTSERWRAVAREAMAAHTETVDAPSTIPADATGLAGKRARIVGPATWASGRPSYCKASKGSVVDIDRDRVDGHGDLRVTLDSGNTTWIAEDPAPDRCRSLFDGKFRCQHPAGHTPGPHESAETGTLGRPLWVWTDRSNRAALIPEPQPAGGGQLIGDIDTLPEPPVGTRLRDPQMRTWVHRDPGETFPWWNYSESGKLVKERLDWVTLQGLGPLHQVWMDRNDIPRGTEYRDAAGVNAFRLSHRLPVNSGAAPFTAVLPFGATA